MQEGGPNHYWISGTDVPYKFELGAQAHEGCAGIVALTRYLQLMAAPSSGQLGCTPPAGSTAYRRMCEAQLMLSTVLAARPIPLHGSFIFCMFLYVCCIFSGENLKKGF